MRIQNKRRSNPLVEPDEIFLDSKNLPHFDTQQFEGTLEQPIKRRPVVSVGVVFLLVLVVFGCRLWYLQIKDGSIYKKESEQNSLSSEPIFAPRGNIYDRNGVPLAWNGTATGDMPWGQREYIQSPGFSHILGYVSYPLKDKSGNYWQTDIAGKDGVEKEYNDELAGVNGSDIVERDITGHAVSGSITDDPVPGKNLTLTIDSRLQTELNKVLMEKVQKIGFQSASGVMMDINTGEILALTNVPEYDPEVMSDGTDSAKIHEYLTDKQSPLLDRAIGGLFAPGSIVKPYIGLEALNEGVIGPMTQIASIGSISIPNPYFPDKPSIYRDYNPDNGWVDMPHALAVSSNIYFMEISGGYKDQKGIGIYNLDTALSRFGLTEKTGIDLPGETVGVLPDPAWKAINFPGQPWLLGDTYNTSIGQYGVQVTPIEMTRAVAAIARRGVLVNPHVLEGLPTVETKITAVPDADYTVVQEGMQLSATIGTGQVLGKIPLSAGSKTGTAQVGPDGQDVNSWMTIFFPYNNPHYAFTIMFEHGPGIGIATAQGGAFEFFSWMVKNLPQYTQ